MIFQNTTNTVASEPEYLDAAQLQKKHKRGFAVLQLSAASSYLVFKLNKVCHRLLDAAVCDKPDGRNPPCSYGEN